MAMSIILNVAALGFIINGITSKSDFFNNSNVTIESLPPPIGTITLFSCNDLKFCFGKVSKFLIPKCMNSSILTLMLFL